MGYFIIRGLQVYDNCDQKIRKNLKPGYYQFTEFEYPGFYGSNISVQAIVGENGSGKSSLLELIFRMVNNFAAVLYRKVQCNAAAKLYYVLGIYADLVYEIDNVKGTLKCQDDIITLEFGNEKKVLYQINSSIDTPGFISLVNIEESEVRKIASHFFYTIVTNYSLQSYVSEDYEDEMLMAYSIGKYGIEKWHLVYGKSWIDSLFDKNDGYLCPITLNPYRTKGIVDMHKESQFATERISSLLIEYSRMNQQYLEGYDLKNIEYRLNYEKVISDFNDEYEGETIKHKKDRILNKFKAVCNYGSPNNIPNAINTIFGCKHETADSTVYWICRLYIVVKVLKIAQKYPSYSKYHNLGDVNRIFDIDIDSKTAQKYKNLARAVAKDESHIGLKVHQAYNMLKNLYRVADPSYFTRVFNYWNYERELQLKSNRSIHQRAQVLPPPFYTPKISFTRIDDHKNKRTVLFNKLSSGEKQFIYTTSSVVYHMLNLRSVKKGRPVYRQFNIVLDEVEICFHPEYQRTFVSRFLRIIKSLGNMDRCRINIIMTTHSPFILSDIIQSNILYLEDGVPTKGKEKPNPFGANVNDILHQSFFLNKGFMGSISQHLYSRLLKFFEESRDLDEYHMDYARNLIDMLGDPFLKRQLQILYDQFMIKKGLKGKLYFENKS